MRLAWSRVLYKDRRMLPVVLVLPLLLLLLHCYEREAGPPSPVLSARGTVVDPSVGELDDSARYEVHTFVVEGNKWRTLASRPATIATHASLDHLHWLVDTASSWTGPISVAVFSPDTESSLALCYISYLRRCHASVREQVSFHVVTPVDRPARLNDTCQWLAREDCSRAPRVVLEEVVRRSGNSTQMLLYPQNILRNVARRTSHTKYVLAADVDMVFPSSELALQLEHFLGHQDGCSLCAFVLPVYEVASDVAACPANKSQLLNLVAVGRARPFHVKVFPENQRKSTLDHWEKMGQAPSVGVAYTVNNYQFWYEPIYVSKLTAPPYDERFIGYGTTRNTQVYEMYLAGWSFKILNNVFLVHWGFQTLTSYTKWRIRQQRDNMLRFQGFIREMAMRYDKDPLGLLKRHPKKNANLEVVHSKDVTQKNTTVKKPK